MTLHLRLEIAGQPRGKANHTTRGGVSYLSGATRDYLAKLQYAAQQEMAGQPPTAQPVRVTVIARFQIAASWSRKKKLAAQLGHIRPCSRPDADNIWKLLDACNSVVWVDDAQIVDAALHKVYSDQPGLTIDIKTIEPPVVPAPLTRVAGVAGDLFAVPP